MNVTDMTSSRYIGLTLGAYSALCSITVAQEIPGSSEAPSIQQAAYQSSIAEEAVRKQTDKIQAEITQLMAELKLNGMNSADLTALANASSHLRSLSQEDMQKVVAALQSASLSTQDQSRQQSLVTAFEGQKDISLALKTLSADLAAQESQRELPAKLEALIVRQSANIRQTKTLPTTGVPIGQLNPVQKTTHDVVSAEQSAISGEIELLVKILEAKPTPTPDTDAPDDTPQAVLETMKGNSLQADAQAAAQSITQGPLPDTVAKQSAVRDLLTSALRTAMAKIDVVTQLQQVKAELSQITDDQENLGATSKKTKLDGATLAERQAKIGDRTSVTQALMKSLCPPASAQTGQAQLAMQESSEALTTAKDPATTAPQQKVVVDALKKAAELLDQQIAATEKEQNTSPLDKLEQLEQLKNEIALQQQSPQPSPSSLQKLQQDAAAVSPPAANKIADAADQFQKPTPDTSAGQKSLADAKDEVQKEEDALKETAKDYQALNDASKQLQQAEQNSADADKSIQQSNASDLTQAAKELTKAQANVAQIQQNANQAGIPKDAQKALQEAADALKEAAMQAVQAKGAEAQAQNQKAMSAMQQAQSGMGKAMAQLQQQSQGKGQGQGQGQGKSGPSKFAGGKAGGSEAPKESGGVLAGSGAGGIAQVVGGLTTKDRDAMTQFQAEKSPPEYSQLVQQYLKNLADSSSSP